jgi:DMSO/TMAO reductase YedYZ molybdopterin-dependent catalytic subunit
MRVGDDDMVSTVAESEIRPLSWWYGAVAGLVTGLAGIATSLAATAALDQRANPVEAVGEQVRDSMPDKLVHPLIKLVGHHDKAFLIAGVTVGLLVLSALAGVLALRRAMLGVLIFVAMGVVAGAVAANRPGATTNELIPVLVGAATWVVLISTLPPTRPATTARAEEVAADRRSFLQRVGVVGVAAVGFGVLSRFLGRKRRAVEAARARLKLPVTTGTVPAGADFGLDGLTPWRVQSDRFYRIDTALVVPVIGPDEWSLRIHGMVDREIKLSYQDLLDRKLTEAWVTLCCVSNPVGGNLIGNAWFSGVRIADLLKEAGVHADADAIKQTSEDGWTCGTPIEAVTDDRNAMLAVAMNGKPLPVEHGFPVRMVVPGLYGYVSATKWIRDIEVSRFDAFQGYWTPRGWSEKGPVKTESRIDVPAKGRAMAGDVVVAGQAWAQHTGIAKVEIRLDGNDWQECDLGRVPGNDTWVQWRTTVHVAAGIHTVAVRATDKSGYTQTGVRQDVLPNGATGWDTVRFTADG